MEDTVNIIVGALFLYAVVHFIVIQFSKTWEDRSKYEQAVTIMALIMLGIWLFGSN